MERSNHNNNAAFNNESSDEEMHPIRGDKDPLLTSVNQSCHATGTTTGTTTSSQFSLRRVHNEFVSRDDTSAELSAVDSQEQVAHPSLTLNTPSPAGGQADAPPDIIQDLEPGNFDSIIYSWLGEPEDELHVGDTDDDEDLDPDLISSPIPDFQNNFIPEEDIVPNADVDVGDDEAVHVSGAPAITTAIPMFYLAPGPGHNFFGEASSSSTNFAAAVEPPPPPSATIMPVPIHINEIEAAPPPPPPPVVTVEPALAPKPSQPYTSTSKPESTKGKRQPAKPRRKRETPFDWEIKDKESPCVKEKIRRENKKQKYKALEEEIGSLHAEIGSLRTENGSLKNKNGYLKTENSFFKRQLERRETCEASSGRNDVQPTHRLVMDKEILNLDVVTGQIQNVLDDFAATPSGKRLKVTLDKEEDDDKGNKSTPN